jgi:MFS family permease
MIFAGLVVLGCFFRWEERVAREGGTPLLRADLLKIPQLRAGLSTIVSQYLILAGTFFVLPLYLQLVLGKNALETGVKILPISITMMIAAMLGPRLATSTSPRRVVQIGLAFLLVSILGLMASISPTLASLPFALSLAGFGVGIGLSISQLGNVVMSSVAESRSSEAGGVQGAAQNLGQSLGTALIGAALLTGLTTGFHERVLADPSIPASLQQQIVSGTQEGLPMISQAQFKGAVAQAGVQEPQAQRLVAYYNESQIDALKRALLLASGFVLVGLWFARALPAEALAREDGDEGVVPAISPAAGEASALPAGEAGSPEVPEGVRPRDGLT